MGLPISPPEVPRVKLPDVDNLLVAFDTEASGLFTDDGARVSAASCAWRDPATNEIVSFATPFDQGLIDLPLGDKVLPSSHAKRMAKVETTYGRHYLEAPNKSPRSWAALMRWLLRQRIVIQNVKYDVLICDAGLRDVTAEMDGNLSPAWAGSGVDLMPQVVWDTMLGFAVVDPGETTSLKPASVRLHLGQEIGILPGAEAEESELLDEWKGPDTDPRFDLIPWSVLGPYAKRDAELLLLAYEYQQPRIDGEPSFRRLFDEDMALMRTLTDMERRGVGYDKVHTLQELSKLEDLIKYAATQVPFKGGVGRPTPPSAVKYFFGSPAEGGQGILPFSDKLTAKAKRPQVDEDVITRLIKMEVPGALEYQSYTELQSARGKWYGAYPDLVGRDGRIRTCHRQGRVVSGRLSVERWQAQALPHDHRIPDGLTPIRYDIVPKPGHQLWEADVSQAEIRVATRVAKERNMLKALKLGIDSHDAAALLMFFQDCTTKQEAIAKYGPKEWDYKRGVVAKRCNLGILYGIGAGGLVTQILQFTGEVVTQHQTRAWIDTWKDAFPSFTDALYEYADLATTSGMLRLSTGRVRKFSEYEPVHKAFNQRIQGEVAEAMKRAMNIFHAQFPGMLLLQIHDSLVAEIPTDRVDEVTKSMQDILVSTFERMYAPVPFKADVKPFGRTYYELAT